MIELRPLGQSLGSSQLRQPAASVALNEYVNITEAGAARESVSRPSERTRLRTHPWLPSQASRASLDSRPKRLEENNGRLAAAAANLHLARRNCRAPWPPADRLGCSARLDAVRRAAAGQLDNRRDPSLERARE